MAAMTSYERVMAAVNHEKVDRVPMMYRGLAETNAKLCSHLGLGDADECWGDIVERLGVDQFAGGSAIGRYTRLAPAYVNDEKKLPSGAHLEHVWGLVGKEVSAKDHTYVDWKNRPMASFTSVKEVEDYPSPDVDDFDFTTMAVDEKIAETALYSVGKLNHIFMISARLRGMDQLLMDMAAEPIMAEAIINKVAEFAVAFNRKALEQAGGKADQYTLWDDIAMQNGMMMAPVHWQKYLRKWYEILYADAKKCGLKVFYHCCGSFHPIIPTLLDIGVDILDPVQTSAKEMDLQTLKDRYGKNVCWHGGIDVQKLLPCGTPDEIRKAVKDAKALFGDRGGIILGPSHDVTPDTPMENIMALYEGQLN